MALQPGDAAGDGRVIGRYTGGDYEEFEMADDQWQGPVQYFGT